MWHDNSPTFVTHATSPFCNRLFMFIAIHICTTLEALYEEITCSSYQALCLFFQCGTRKEVRMEICVVAVSTTHELNSWHYKSYTQMTHDYWSEFKICEHLQVIENEYQVWVELYIATVYNNFVVWYMPWNFLQQGNFHNYVKQYCECCINELI